MPSVRRFGGAMRVKTALAVLLVAMPGSAYAMCQTPVLLSGSPFQNQAAQQAFQNCLANERFQQQQMQMQQQQLEMQRQQQRQMQQLNQPDYTIAMQGHPTVELMNPMVIAQQMQAIQAARAQAERDRTEAQLLYEQNRALQRQNDATSNKVTIAPPPVAPPGALPSYMQEWLVAAQPRMHLFDDFDAVVFAPDVSISDDMIKFMAAHHSPLAADVAYYLGKHKAEALAISQMPSIKQAAAIHSIEYRLSIITGISVK